MRPAGIRVIGLTGGVATGKSSVARFFLSKGAPVIDADQLAREAVEPGSRGLAEVAAVFGTGVLAPDGRLDRKRLGELVFSDSARRSQLEAILHPEIKRLAEERIASVAKTGQRVVFYMAPLLIEAGVTDRVDVHMGTLGKALGSFGAYVAGSRRLVDLLVSKARTFVFTTALPPAACGAALAALDVLASEPGRRERLHGLALRMKAGLARLGFDVARVVAPIFPVVLDTEERALAASRALRARGFFVRAIRPPTVPRGTSRLRVALTAGHAPEQVDAFLGALEEVVGELPAR